MSSVLNDLADAIEECSVDLDGIRFLRPPVTRGRVTNKAAESTFPFRGSLQALNGRELQRLPEGQRNSGRKKLYTSTLLNTVKTSEGKLADRVVYSGITYQVDKVQDWEELGGYYRVELERMDR